MLKHIECSGMFTFDSRLVACTFLGNCSQNYTLSTWLKRMILVSEGDAILRRGWPIACSSHTKVLARGANSTP